MINNNMMGLYQKSMQFKQTLQTDPQQQIQQMLNSGKINQQQYNNAFQQARQLQQMFSGIFK